jgi:spermidine/putrescine-binding protein
MNKLRILMLAAVVCAVSPVWAQPKELVLYTWEEMFPQSILDRFERETGIKVIYKTFELNEEMLDELVHREGGGYDLVIADDYILEFVISWDLARKLDKSKLPNLGNVSSHFKHQFYDPQDEYTFPYGAGVQTIVYDPAKVHIDIKGYADLWNSALKGGVGIIGNYRVINGMALKVLGKSYNVSDVADIRAAGDRLKALAPNIRVIEDTTLDEFLVKGDISAAVMYSDQVMRSIQAKPGLKKVFPREGIGFGIMGAFVPVKAPNADGAHRFLNYILDARRGAECFNYLGYYCTYEASEAFIDPALREFLILPDFKNFEMIQNLPQDAEDEHARIWETFLSAVHH